MFSRLLFFTCLLGSGIAQPGITFDSALHCWVNITSSMEVTYTPSDFQIINDYVNETVFQVVDELPLEEQGPALIELEEKIINDLYYTIEPPNTAADFDSLVEIAPGSLFLRYMDIVTSTPSLLFELMVIVLETVLHTCYDGEPEPDYRTVLRETTQSITDFVFTAPDFTMNDVETILNITSASLTAAWEAIEDTGIDFNIVTLEIVEGLLLGYQNHTDEGFDIQLFANEVIEQAQAIAPEGTTLLEPRVIINNATEILGIEIDA